MDTSWSPRGDHDHWMFRERSLNRCNLAVFVSSEFLRFCYQVINGHILTVFLRTSGPHCEDIELRADEPWKSFTRCTCNNVSIFGRSDFNQSIRGQQFHDSAVSYKNYLVNIVMNKQRNCIKCCSNLRGDVISVTWSLRGHETQRCLTNYNLVVFVSAQNFYRQC